MTIFESTVIADRAGRRRQPGQLVFDGPHGAATRIEFQAFNESGKAVLNLDIRRVGPQGFGVQVREDKPGFRAEWQQQIDKLSGFRNCASAINWRTAGRLYF